MTAFRHHARNAVYDVVSWLVARQTSVGAVSHAAARCSDPADRPGGGLTPVTAVRPTT